MRVFALSDVHVDFEANARWIRGLSQQDYTDDVLLLAGDVTHQPSLLAECLTALRSRMAHVLFVPGNHDLWVIGEDDGKTSLQKFEEVRALAADCGVSMSPCTVGDLHIVPLFSWYDYSFGQPGEELSRTWMDFRACRWPEGWSPDAVAAHFDDMNPTSRPAATRVITFSHFLPRIDLVPFYVPQPHRILDPVLGSSRIERGLRRLAPDIHVYGHSHINRSVMIDGIRYVNNAFGYPREERIAARRMLCIDEV